MTWEWNCTERIFSEYHVSGQDQCLSGSLCSRTCCSIFLRNQSHNFFSSPSKTGPLEGGNTFRVLWLFHYCRAKERSSLFQIMTLIINVPSIGNWSYHHWKKAETVNPQWFTVIPLFLLLLEDHSLTRWYLLLWEPVYKQKSLSLQGMKRGEQENNAGRKWPECCLTCPGVCLFSFKSVLMAFGSTTTSLFLRWEPTRPWALPSASEQRREGLAAPSGIVLLVVLPVRITN